jgi:hypothetical protein
VLDHMVLEAIGGLPIEHVHLRLADSEHAVLVMGPSRNSECRLSGHFIDVSRAYQI